MLLIYHIDHIQKRLFGDFGQTKLDTFKPVWQNYVSDPFDTSDVSVNKYTRQFHFILLHFLENK